MENKTEEKKENAWSFEPLLFTQLQYNSFPFKSEKKELSLRLNSSLC